MTSILTHKEQANAILDAILQNDQKTHHLMLSERTEMKLWA